MTQSLLVAHNQALNNFLDDLLTEDVEDTSFGAVELSTPVESADELEIAPVMLHERDDAIPVDTVKPGHVVPSFSEDGRIPILPDWGLQSFQAMVFKVGDLSLAIPLTELAGVVEWQPATTASGLDLGDYQHAEQTVRVVDLAQLVFMGPHLDELIKTDAQQRVTRIILTNNGRWGLACDAVHEVITIEPTRVNWRSTQTRRQWLAGTLLDDMTVVLDVKSTTEILSKMLADLE